MKPFNFFKLFLFFASFALFITSCTDDGIGTGTNNPKLDFLAGTGVITSDATVNVGESFTVNLAGTKGDNPMSTLTIQEAGTKITDLNRLTFSHTTGAGNPLTLTGANASSFDFKVTIKAHTEIATKTYSFIVADAQGNSVTKSLAITTVGTPPVITQPSTELVFDIETSKLFTTEFIVTKGTSPLASVEVLINDVKATELDRLFYADLQTPFTSNPFSIPAADKNNLKKDIIFRSPATSGTYKYTIKFTDETGLSSSVNIIANVGTPVNLLVGILLNQSGPAGQGGLDLDTGASTGSADTKAEIRDEGVVDPVNDGTWKQQISAANDAEIKYIKKGKNGIAENFDFKNIKFKDQIPALWQNGEAFVAKSTDNNRLVSSKVEVGDIFIVKRADKYYLITVKEIKITTETSGDNRNKDSYTFDVKF